MDLLVKNSIKSFLEELRKRVELLLSSKVTENIDNSKYNELINELSRHGIASEDPITESSIKGISDKDLKQILILADANPESADYIIGHLDHESFYSKITDIINKYISDYKKIGLNQNEMINEKISLYQKYITLFEEENLSEPFEELNEISKVMSEVGLPDQDKWRILEYIALINTNLMNEVDINLSIQIEREYEKIKDYLEDENIKSVLIKKFTDEEIDIDIIPTTASELAKELEMDVDIVNNIVVVSLASKKLDELKHVDKEEYQKEYISIINDILEFIVPLHKTCVYEARKIKESTQDFYYNSIQNGISDEMINSYLETPLSLIEEDNTTYEHAIELKELSVLKPIYETLNTITELDITTPEYEKATNILAKLVEQYQLLESKKETDIKRIN